MDNLLEPEFEQPFKAWQAQPTPENTNQLLKTVNPVLTAALRSYGTTNSPTLHTRAKIMALSAMKRYDPSQSKLRTHLMFQLQGLRRHAAREAQILSVPEQVALDLGHLHEGENVLRDRLGRDPSDGELSNHLHLSLKRIKYIRKARPTYAEGAYQRQTDEGEDLYSPAVQPQSPVDMTIGMLYHDLAPTDQVILDYTLGLHGKPKLLNQDIAKKLRISPGAVSQRKAKIQQKTQELGDFNLFG